MIKKFFCNISSNPVFLTGCATQDPNKRLSGPGDGVVSDASNIRHIVSAMELENAAKKEFEKIKNKAKENNELVDKNNPVLKKACNDLKNLSRTQLHGICLSKLGLGSNFNQIRIFKCFLFSRR